MVRAGVSDYQIFELANGALEGIGERMQAKMRAIPLPDLKGKSVLDIGCDFGFWCWLSILQGASRVVGVDRNRSVRGMGMVDLSAVNTERARQNGWLERTEFKTLQIGSQYPDIGRFDVVYLFSLYHHIYSAAGGDHKTIWYWLRRQMKPCAELLWENPIDSTDTVVRLNMPPDYWPNYNMREILAAAGEYFDCQKIGPALHEPTREVWRFIAKPAYRAKLTAFVESGGKGAKGAFQYADGRRMKEIEKILGFVPFAGSLNLRLMVDFPFEENYFRAQMLDVKDREKGLESEWTLKWVRFYPLKVNGEKAYALRFEGESYANTFVEVISEHRLDIPNLMVYRDRGPSNFYNSKTGEQAIEVLLEIEK